MEILDSSYILHSDLNFSDGTYMIPSSILDEIKKEDKVRISLEIGIRKGNIRIVDPKEKTIEKVKKIAKETGDLPYLSYVDITLLALALETKNLLITDDYRIQNVASHLKLKWKSFSQRGIRKKLKWVKICEGCGKEYDCDEKICKICGSKLKKISKPFEN